MKTLIQKIHLEEHQSFACRSYRTPNFETNWHKHEEFELILLNEGHGTAMIGDYIGEYKAGDVYFIAGNLPHWFKKQHPKVTGCSVVIHFKPDIFGKEFLLLPELKNIHQLLLKNDGIQIQSKLKKEMAAAIPEMESLKGFQRISLLLNCLQKISSSSNFNTLTRDFTSNNNTAALPAATAITDSFIISGKLLGSEINTLSQKYVILAWSGTFAVTTHRHRSSRVVTGTTKTQSRKNDVIELTS